MGGGGPGDIIKRPPWFIRSISMSTRVTLPVLVCQTWRHSRHIVDDTGCATHRLEERTLFGRVHGLSLLTLEGLSELRDL